MTQSNRPPNNEPGMTQSNRPPNNEPGVTQSNRPPGGGLGVIQSNRPPGGGLGVIQSNRTSSSSHGNIFSNVQQGNGFGKWSLKRRKRGIRRPPLTSIGDTTYCVTVTPEGNWTIETCHGIKLFVCQRDLGNVHQCAISGKNGAVHHGGNYNQIDFTSSRRHGLEVLRGSRQVV
ncbi:hypothetical protein LSH36_141g00034 [Paralvinella palmiformis]|uniref:Uncharacterized protein n=1 Tax=Paralvinella palmiformis TaxID=53620 RepID=A0AAD9NAG3_9ANNE|nr:hypothetical protein LSH36_141g00034 [Paralvinella palmiformis]